MPPEMLIQRLQPIPGENHNIPTMSPQAVAAADMTLLERQIVRLNWRQQQQPSYFAAPASTSLSPYPFNITQLAHTFPSSVGSLQAGCLSGEQGMMISHNLPSRPASVWPDLRDYPLLSNCSVSGGVTGGVGGNDILRTFSCPAVVGNVETRGTLSPPASPLEQAASTTKDAAAMAPSSERTKKRKCVERFCPKKVEGDGTDKRVKVENSNDLSDENVESPPINMCSASTAVATTIDYKNGNCEASKRVASSSGGSKEAKAKVPEPPPKTDYIHVRARRGQATDSHSLAERVRREKISERMKLLQDLVPGCNKITGKAGMLDEIINYVQSLQRQVEFLSMKLAAVTPACDFNILDALFTKEINFPACGGGITAAPMGVLPELLDLSFLQINPLQQPMLAVADQCCGLPAPVVSSSCSPVEAALRATAGAPEPCSFLGSYDQMHQPSTTSGWDGELQRFYRVEELAQGRRGIPTDAAAAPTFQPLIHGNQESDSLKMEM